MSRHFQAAMWRGSRIVEWSLQSVVDFLIEDSCVLCGRADTSTGLRPNRFDGPARLFLDPVKCPCFFGTLSITNHPVCGCCAAGFEVARNSARIAPVTGPTGVESVPDHPGGQKSGEANASESTPRVSPVSLLGETRDITVVAPFMTNDNILKIIHLVKFRRYRALIRPIARTIGHAARSFDVPTGGDVVLVPTPMERADLRKRGFNQAERIAFELGRDLGLPLLTESLKKTRRTAPQSRTKHADRAENVRRAFTCVGEEPTDKHVLLVDDLVTTGATAASCAVALDRVGARRVTVLCFGRAV